MAEAHIKGTPIPMMRRPLPGRPGPLVIGGAFIRGCTFNTLSPATTNSRAPSSDDKSVSEGRTVHVFGLLLTLNLALISLTSGDPAAPAGQVNLSAGGVRHPGWKVNLPRRCRRDPLKIDEFEIECKINDKLKNYRSPLPWPLGLLRTLLGYRSGLWVA